MINFSRSSFVGCLLIAFPIFAFAFSPGSGIDYSYPLNDAAQVPEPLDSDFYLTKGESNVMQGAFQYALPISLPPSANSIAPQLSFSYSSRNVGDGPFGVGWRLAGLGAITRCSAIFAVEGVQAQKPNPRYSNGDRLCLNGHKMVLKDGPKDASDSSYWAGNAEYKTEVDTFSKIVANGNHTQFVVYLRNGLIQTYGDDQGQNSTYYRPGFSGGKISRWSLSKTEDRYGNTYKVFYDYDLNDFEQVVKKIEIDPNVVVSFDYMHNAQPRFGFDKGYKYIKRKIIDRVTVKKVDLSSQSHVAYVRSYKFAYPSGAVSGNTTSTNKFETITECGYEGGGQEVEVCGLPLTMGWADIPSFGSYYGVSSGDGGGVHPGGFYQDVDGDGYSDHVEEGRLTIRTPSGNQSYSLGATGSFLTPIKLKSGIGIVRSKVVNGTSLQIRISRKQNGSSNFTSTLLQTGSSSSAPRGYVADFNNDGLEDICIFDWCYLQSPETGELDLENRWDPDWAAYNADILDVNSDGLPDRIRSITLFSSASNYVEGKIVTDLGTGHSFDNSLDPNFPHWDVQATVGRVGVPDLSTSNSAAIGASLGVISVLADLNGDGLRDILYRNNSGKLSARLNTGYGLTDEIASPFDIGYGVGFAADFNGDGLEDFFHTWGEGSYGYMYVYMTSIVDGNIVFTRKPVKGVSGVDSNGRCDYQWFPDACEPLANRVITDEKLMAIGDLRDQGEQLFAVNNKIYRMGAGTKGRNNVLRTVTDGMGSQTSVDYGNLTPAGNAGNSGIYNKNPLYMPDKAEYPYASLPRSTRVVQRIQKSNGVGGVSQDYYLYRGGKVDTAGRGNLGFSEVRQVRYNRDTLDSNGLRVPVLEDAIHTWYHQNFPYIGRIKRLTTIGRNGDKTSDRYSYYQVHAENPGFPYEHRRFEVKFESIQDVHPGAPLTPTGTSEQTFVYDRFGNLTNSHLVRGISSYHLSGLKVDNPKHHTVITNNYDNSEADHLIGFLREMRTDTYFHDGSDFRSSCQSFTREAGTLDVKVSANNCDWYSDSSLNIQINSYLRNEKGVVTGVNSIGSDPAGLFSVRTITYEDFEFGIYPRTIIDNLGDSTYVEYDARHSLISKVTDANGFSTENFYDPWGRASEQHDLTTGNRTLSGVQLCNLQNCPENAKYFSSSQVVNSAEHGRVAEPVGTIFYDMLGREIHRETHSVGGVLKVDTEYDERGNIHRVSDVYSGSVPLRWTTYTYDEKDRVQTEVSSRLERSIQYETLSASETIVIDSPNGPESQTKTTFYNSLGQVRRVLDNMSNTVDYTYDSHGNLATTVVNEDLDTQVVITHDNMGNRTQIVDPDAGSVAFSYNGFGEQRFQIWQQGTANEKSMEFIYDGLGRKTQRIDTYPNGSTERFRWEWDTQFIGALAAAYREQDQIGQYYTYNTKGQVASVGPWGAPGSPKYNYQYDHFGRVSQISYPLGQLVVERKYHSLGQHVRTINAGSQQPIWELGNSMDAQGALTHERYGNGVITQRTYHPSYHSVQSIEAGINGLTNVQSLSFNFDGVGNLHERQVERFQSGSIVSYNETFDYDALHRLINDGTHDLASPCGNNYCYDGLGNLTYKSDVGSLLYDQINGAGVHAITSGAGRSYQYDAYGNMTSRGSQTITYDVFNKPTRINNTYYMYGADHELLKQTSYETWVETFYVSGLFGEKFEALVEYSGVEKYRHYVDSVMLYETGTNISSPTISYLHYDHLGSVETITDASGNIKDHLSYNSWGERRQDDWAAGDPTLGLPFFYGTQTGFTGHEMLDHHGLIHMGGRVYDPVISRFLSADLFIQAPLNSQSFNRYSYVFNNPLSAVDPTGYYCEAGWCELNNNEMTRSILWSNMSVIISNLGDAAYSARFGDNACGDAGNSCSFYNHGSSGTLDLDFNHMNAVISNAQMNGMAATMSGMYASVSHGVPGIGAVAQEGGGERTWGSYLPGTEAGDNAAQYWADIAVNSDHPLAPLAHVSGVFAALWTEETAANTAFTLGTAGTGGIAARLWGNSLLAPTLGNSKIGHRLFTATRQNGSWNTGKWRFGWSGKNGSDTYSLMLRYKKHHSPPIVNTTRAHPSAGGR